MIDFPITINGNTVYAKELFPLIRKCNSDEAKRIIIEETKCTEKTKVAVGVCLIIRKLRKRLTLRKPTQASLNVQPAKAQTSKRFQQHSGQAVL